MYRSCAYIPRPRTAAHTYIQGVIQLYRHIGKTRTPAARPAPDGEKAIHPAPRPSDRAPLLSRRRESHTHTKSAYCTRVRAWAASHGASTRHAASIGSAFPTCPIVTCLDATSCARPQDGRGKAAAALPCERRNLAPALAPAAAACRLPAWRVPITACHVSPTHVPPAACTAARPSREESIEHRRLARPPPAVSGACPLRRCDPRARGGRPIGGARVAPRDEEAGT